MICCTRWSEWGCLALLVTTMARVVLFATYMERTITPTPAMAPTPRSLRAVRTEHGDEAGGGAGQLAEETGESQALQKRLRLSYAPGRAGGAVARR